MNPNPGNPPHSAYVVSFEGSLRAPLDGELASRISALVGRGARTVVLDLAAVPTIDAAGIGELVRAYNVTAAANGVLRIANATERVRDVLERVGLFDLLTGGRETDDNAPNLLRSA